MHDAAGIPRPTQEGGSLFINGFPSGPKPYEEVLTFLRKGSQLQKYGRHGAPKHHHFRLSSDDLELQWESKGRIRRIAIEWIQRWQKGQETSTFKRHPQPLCAHLSFSLMYFDHSRKERTLDVICNNAHEFELWYWGIQIVRHYPPYRWNAHVQARAEELRRGTHAVRMSMEMTENSLDDAQSYDSEPKLAGSTAGGSGSRGPSNQGNQPSRRELGDLYIWGSLPVMPESELQQLVLGRAITHPQLGAEDPMLSWQQSSQPVLVSHTSSMDVVAAACASRHAALITRAGELYTWGYGRGGNLGQGSQHSLARPHQVARLRGKGIKTVACSEGCTAAISSDGRLFTWGAGLEGQLGHGHAFPAYEPKLIVGIFTDALKVEQVSCGPYHTAAIASDGALYTWGCGYFGALGHGDCTTHHRPRKVMALADYRVTNVSCGWWHSAAVATARPRTSLSCDTFQQYDLSGSVADLGGGGGGSVSASGAWTSVSRTASAPSAAAIAATLDALTIGMAANSLPNIAVGVSAPRPATAATTTAGAVRNGTGPVSTSAPLLSNADGAASPAVEPVPSAASSLNTQVVGTPSVLSPSQLAAAATAPAAPVGDGNGGDNGGPNGASDPAALLYGSFSGAFLEAAQAAGGAVAHDGAGGGGVHGGSDGSSAAAAAAAAGAAVAAGGDSPEQACPAADASHSPAAAVGRRQDSGLDALSSRSTTVTQDSRNFSSSVEYAGSGVAAESGGGAAAAGAAAKGAAAAAAAASAAATPATGLTRMSEDSRMAFMASEDSSIRLGHSSMLFTWGGECLWRDPKTSRGAKAAKGQGGSKEEVRGKSDHHRGCLGTGDTLGRLLPTRVCGELEGRDVVQVGCGWNLTVALTRDGRVFQCGTTGASSSDDKASCPWEGSASPCLVEGQLIGRFVEEIAVGQHHVAAVASRSNLPSGRVSAANRRNRLFTWGQSAAGQLGLGPNAQGRLTDHASPQVVQAIDGQRIVHIACGGHHTLAVCEHDLHSSQHSTQRRHPAGVVTGAIHAGVGTLAAGASTMLSSPLTSTGGLLRDGGGLLRDGGAMILQSGGALISHTLLHNSLLHSLQSSSMSSSTAPGAKVSSKEGRRRHHRSSQLMEGREGSYAFSESERDCDKTRHKSPRLVCIPTANPTVNTPLEALRNAHWGSGAISGGLAAAGAATGARPVQRTPSAGNLMPVVKLAPTFGSVDGRPVHRYSSSGVTLSGADRVEGGSNSSPDSSVSGNVERSEVGRSDAQLLLGDSLALDHAFMERNPLSDALLASAESIDIRSQTDSFVTDGTSTASFAGRTPMSSASLGLPPSDAGAAACGTASGTAGSTLMTTAAPLRSEAAPQVVSIVGIPHVPHVRTTSALAPRSGVTATEAVLPPLAPPLGHLSTAGLNRPREVSMTAWLQLGSSVRTASGGGIPPVATSSATAASHRGGFVAGALPSLPEVSSPASPTSSNTSRSALTSCPTSGLSAATGAAVVAAAAASPAVAALAGRSPSRSPVRRDGAELANSLSFFSPARGRVSRQDDSSDSGDEAELERLRQENQALVDQVAALQLKIEAMSAAQQQQRQQQLLQQHLQQRDVRSGSPARSIGSVSGAATPLVQEPAVAAPPPDSSLLFNQEALVVGGAGAENVGLITAATAALQRQRHRRAISMDVSGRPSFTELLTNFHASSFRTPPPSSLATPGSVPPPPAPSSATPATARSAALPFPDLHDLPLLNSPTTATTTAVRELLPSSRPVHAAVASANQTGGRQLQLSQSHPLPLEALLPVPGGTELAASAPQPPLQPPAAAGEYCTGGGASAQVSASSASLNEQVASVAMRASGEGPPASAPPAAASQVPSPYSSTSVTSSEAPPPSSQRFPDLPSPRAAGPVPVPTQAASAAASLHATLPTQTDAHLTSQSLAAAAVAAAAAETAVMSGVADVSEHGTPPGAGGHPTTQQTTSHATMTSGATGPASGLATTSSSSGGISREPQSTASTTSTTNSPPAAAPPPSSRSSSASASSSRVTWVDEPSPGVYLWLQSPPSESTATVATAATVTPAAPKPELVKLRFSKKGFSHTEAYRWWDENKAWVCEKYVVNIAAPTLGAPNLLGSSPSAAASAASSSAQSQQQQQQHPDGRDSGGHHRRPGSVGGTASGQAVQARHAAGGTAAGGLQRPRGSSEGGVGGTGNSNSASAVADQGRTAGVCHHRQDSGGSTGSIAAHLSTLTSFGLPLTSVGSGLDEAGLVGDWPI